MKKISVSVDGEDWREIKSQSHSDLTDGDAIFGQEEPCAWISYKIPLSQVDAWVTVLQKVREKHGNL